MSGFGSLNDVESIGTVHCRKHLEILSRQLCLEQPDVRENIVNHEDAGSHDERVQKPIDGLEEAQDRDRFGNIGFAATFPDLVFVALHGKSRHRNDRNVPQVIGFLEPFGHFDPRHLGQLNIHEDEIGLVLARKIEGRQPIARLDHPVTVGFQKIAEQFHIEFVVLDNEDCFDAEPRPRCLR